jgi:hypothetical protein
MPAIRHTETRYDPLFQAINPISMITSPLSEIHLPHFFYVEINKASNLTLLCNHRNALEYFLFDTNILSSLSDMYIKPENTHEFAAYVWPTTPQDDFQKMLFTLGLWHGMTISKETNETLELFFFAADSDKSYVYTNHINRLHLLRRFAIYFKERTASLIKKIESLNLISLKTPLKGKLSLIEPDINQFINALDTKHQLLDPKHGCLELSQVEYGYLSHLSAGYSIRETAEHYDLPPKVLEAAINTIRLRSNCTSKMELIITFNEQRKP